MSLHGSLRAGADGRELLGHVERVVSMVPRDAEAVAWLHEAMEHGGCTYPELERAGLGADDIRAIGLLSRESGTDDDESYLRHLAAIAGARGNAGRIARIVKVADLNDRLLNPRPRQDGWCPPYAEAISALREAHPFQSETRSSGRG